MFSIPLRALLPVILAVPVLAQSPPPTRGGSRPTSAWEDRVHLRRFQEPSDFSLAATWIGFEPLMPGMGAAGPLGVHGLRLELGRGGQPRIWVDRNDRCLPSSIVAISNRAGATPDRFSIAPAQEDDECALRMTFELPVNRVAFELRRTDGEELNVIVRCFAAGEELGDLFYDVGADFTFVGVVSSRAFDEIRVDFTNPSQAGFSLDNLIHELDLRDADRDGLLDVEDLCPNTRGPEQKDSDGDGIGDACDAFAFDALNDRDGDGIGRPFDNCPTQFNPDQSDTDLDGIGDSCDEYAFGVDMDRDGIGDLADNCISQFNPDQADCDLDGIGDACDQQLVHPSSVRFNLERGECVTLTKNVCVPPAPPVVDVAIVFDTTGSMEGEIQLLRENIVDFVTDVRNALPLSNIEFALVSLRDYPGSYSSCGYSARYSRLTDVPFEVVSPIGGGDGQLMQALSLLNARGGQDQAEAYSRALWEVAQPDSGIEFRQNSARFVLMFGDAPPHDCQLAAFIPSCLSRVSTGGDPGRDAILGTPDDIDFQQDAVPALMVQKIPILMVYTGLLHPCAWEQWAGLTGGKSIQASSSGELPQTTSLARELIDLIRDPEVDQVTFAAENPCGLDVRFDPPFIAGPIDVSLGAQVSFEETICVPPDLPLGADGIDCDVRIFADDVLIGTQRIHIDVDCSLHVLDFETEDDFETLIHNGQALGGAEEFGRLVTISSAGPNLGCAAFDSTPGGPNDPSINSDMLVGHGNLLLLQESARPRQTTPGFFDQVTDDSDGGDMIFDFRSPVDPKSVLLADINPPPNLGSYVILVDEAGKRRSYRIEPGWTGPYGNAGPWRLDLTTIAPQPGNGTPRWARATQDAGFQQDGVVRIIVRMTGFGAMDELTFCQK